MRRPDPDVPVWRDGAWIDAGEPDAALSPWAQEGVGAFETFGVREGRALDVEAHLARLAETAEHWSIRLPEATTLDEVVRRLAAAVPGSRGWVKTIAHREGPVVACAGRVDPARVGAPCTAIVLPGRRHADDPTVGFKLTSWAWADAGLEAARRAGVDEGLWRNQRGHFTEACTANLFVVRGRKLFTASRRDGVLPGIVRAHAISAARELGLAVHEGKLRRTRLREAREAFLTSAVSGVRPLVAVDRRPVGDGRPGTWTVRIAEIVEARRRVSDLAAGAVAGTPVRR